MEITEPQKPDQKPGQEPQQNAAKKLGTGLVLSIVILSVLGGAAAGGAAALYFTKEANPGSNIQFGKTNVSEDSAIIDVVTKDSPAVVSIVASEDVSQLQADNQMLSPYFLDPFFQFRGNSSTTPKNTQPQYQDVSAGSGFFVSADGLILTNKHVVSTATAKYTIFTNDGKKYDAKILSTDPLNDLALVKIDITNAPFLNFADSAQIKIGQRVVAIGNSLGQYKNTVTSGIVSGIGRDVTAGGDGMSEQLEGVVQTDAAINPGNSGGPLLNIFGEVIGVNTAIDQQGQLVGFAIPANDAATAVNSYKKFGKIVRPFLGVRYELVNDSIQTDNKLAVNYGAWVTSSRDASGAANPAVVPGSAADKAGVKDGDIILQLNGQRIDTDHSLSSMVKRFSPGDKITLQGMRGKATISLTVILDQSK